MAGRSFLDRSEFLFISPMRIRQRIEYILSELILDVILSFTFFPSLFCVCISSSVPIFLFSSVLSSFPCCQALHNFFCRFFSVCIYASVPTFFFNSLLPSFSFAVGPYPCRFLCLVFYLYLYLCADIFH